MVKMVDITSKSDVVRIACAKGRIKLRPETIERIKNNDVEKGDVIDVTKVVVLSAVKKTSEMLPFCHPIQITHIDTSINLNEEYIEVEVCVKAYAKTGVEMEALMGVSMALLNIWDMVKKYEKDPEGQYPHTSIEYIKVIEKKKVEV